MENVEQQTIVNNIINARASEIQGQEQLQNKDPTRIVSQQFGPGSADILTSMASMNLEQLTGLTVLLIPDFQLTSSLPPGTDIFWYQNTIGKFFKTFTNTVFSYMDFIRFEITFHVRILSSPQVQGQLLMTYDNMPNVLSNLMFFKDKLYYMRLPRKMITLGHNGDYSMTIPWNCPYEKLGRDSYGWVQNEDNAREYDMGSFSISVFNTPTYVAGVSPPSLRLWATVSNITYSGFDPNKHDITQ